jgi:hypothetical protein
MFLDDFNIKVDIFSFLYLKEDLEYYRRLKYWDYINQLNLYFHFSPYYRFFFLDTGDFLLGKFIFVWYMTALENKNLKVYSIKTSTLNINYNMNPIIISFVANSFVSVIQRLVRHVLNIFFKKNLLLMLRLSFYFQGLHMYEPFQMASYTGVHKHNSFNHICYTLFNMDICCIEGSVNLSSKYERKLFSLESKNFLFFYFFIDLINYARFLDNNFYFLVNKIFDHILKLQFVEYSKFALERTMFYEIGSIRKKRKVKRVISEDYFFLDF